MARSPMQVIAIPFIKEDDEYQFAIFQRQKRSGEFWQWISGGAEDDESPKQAVIRELLEEAQISTFNNLYKLDSMCSISRIYYKDIDHWSQETLVVPEHSFAVELSNKNIKISSEHQQYEWVSYDRAVELLKFDSNRTALWELFERLKFNSLEKCKI